MANNLLLLIFAAIFSFSSAAYSGQIQCENAFGNHEGEVRFAADGEELVAPKLAAQNKISVEDFVKVLALDPKTAELFNDPMLLTYTYLRVIEKDLSQDQVNYYLSMIREHVGRVKIDLYDTVQKKVLDKLADPGLKAQVKKMAPDLEPVDAKTASGLRRRQMFKQILAIPRSLARMKSLAAKHYARSVMDRGLFDFIGAVKYQFKESTLREWDKVEGSFGAVRASQIFDMSPEMWARIAIFSSEVEGGIKGYSEQSGEVFRGFMPALAFFMGKNREEAAKLGTDSRFFCSHTWCREENRHEGAMRSLFRQILGINPPPENPSEAYHQLSPFKPDDAVYHLFSRNATEWNANSGYLLQMTHSDGAAHAWVNNVRADETKHLAIFSGAFKYVFGTQIFHRFKKMLQKIAGEFKYESNRTDSNNNPLEGAGVSMFELAMSHVFVEYYAQKYIHSVPLRTLKKLFEVEPAVQDEWKDVDPDKRALIEKMRAEEKASRENLARWTPAERERTQSQTAFEKKNAAYLEKVIKEGLKSFAGAEVAGSEMDLRLRNDIADLTAARTGFMGRDLKFLKRCLLENLRDYQILSSPLLVKRGYTIQFKNAWEGFEIMDPEQPASPNSAAAAQLKPARPN